MFIKVKPQIFNNVILKAEIDLLNTKKPPEMIKTLNKF